MISYTSGYVIAVLSVLLGFAAGLVAMFREQPLDPRPGPVAPPPLARAGQPDDDTLSGLPVLMLDQALQPPAETVVFDRAAGRYLW